ncbi:MAG: LPS-assembly protein LptD, partial [Psychromonas sp.]|nr:LPS-assembly protein LptD [Psychromonas sp.]
MFKKFPWLLLLLPLSNSVAEQQTVQPIADSEDLTEDEIIAPRSTEFFFRQCYNGVPERVPSTNSKPNEQIPVNIDAFSLSGSTKQLTYQDDVQL